MTGSIEVMEAGAQVRQRADGEPAAPTEVSAVVVCYRSADDVDACLTALEAALDGLAAEVVVVDNASDDGTLGVLSSTRPGLAVTARDVNDGFARGCHAGAERATGRRLLFVNPDALVDPHTVRALLAAAEQHPDAGVLGGRALRADGSTDPRSWWGRPTLWSTLCFATGLSSLFAGHPLLDPEAPDRWDGSAREVPVVSGALMLVDRAVWHQLGGFDRDILLYGEDVDLCLRARQAGWRPRVVPDATFRHAVGASTPGPTRTVLVMRGRASVLRRHLRPGTRRLGVGLLVMGTGLRAAGADVAARRHRRRTDVTQASGWREAWRRRRDWAGGWQRGDSLATAVRSGS